MTWPFTLCVARWKESGKCRWRCDAPGPPRRMMQMHTSRLPGIRPVAPDPRPAHKPAPAPSHDPSHTDFVQPNVIHHVRPVRKSEKPKG